MMRCKVKFTDELGFITMKIEGQTLDVAEAADVILEVLENIVIHSVEQGVLLVEPDVDTVLDMMITTDNEDYYIELDGVDFATDEAKVTAIIFGLHNTINCLESNTLELDDLFVGSNNMH